MTFQTQDDDARTLRQQVSQADADVKEKSDNLAATLTQLSKVEQLLQDTERQYSEQITIITVSHDVTRRDCVMTSHSYLRYVTVLYECCLSFKLSFCSETRRVKLPSSRAVCVTRRASCPTSSSCRLSNRCVSDSHTGVNCCCELTNAFAFSL